LEDIKMAKYLQINLFVTEGEIAVSHQNKQPYKFSGMIHGGDPNIEEVIEELRDMMVKWLVTWLRYDGVRIEMEDHMSVPLNRRNKCPTKSSSPK